MKIRADYLPTYARACINGCGRRADLRDLYCIPCQLAGSAGNLPGESPSPRVTSQRLREYELTCLLCATRWPLHCTEADARRVALVVLRCGHCGGSVYMELAEYGQIGSPRTDLPVQRNGAAWRVVPTGRVA